MRKLLTPPVACLAIFALASNAFAQQLNPRYELGWRLRQLERAWSANSDVEKRKEALPFVERAVQEFFSLKFASAAESLDRATNEFSPFRTTCNWNLAWSVTPEARLIDVARCSDSSRSRFRCEARVLYDPCVGSGGVASPINGLQFRFGSQPGEDYYPQDLEVIDGEVSLTGLSTGDVELEVRATDGDFVNAEHSLTISIVERRDERLSALEAAIEALPENAPPLERETSKALLELLNSLAKGSTEECDYPGARLLAECEQVVAAAAKGERFYGSARTGQHWLAVPTGAKRPARVRVFIPATKFDAPPPLVVALHGAGGSENMFFETYGDGEIVRQCERRGWMLVAPRVGFGLDIPALVDALAERYPFDRTRVFLVGHSMGAATAISAATAKPERFRAMAALGGGRAPKRPESLKAMPVFIGAGERDFGRPGAKELHDALVASGSGAASLRVYPNTEHLLIVQEALPDVFALFDGLAGVEGHSIEPLDPQPRDR